MSHKVTSDQFVQKRTTVVVAISYYACCDHTLSNSGKSNVFLVCGFHCSYFYSSFSIAFSIEQFNRWKSSSSCSHAGDVDRGVTMSVCPPHLKKRFCVNFTFMVPRGWSLVTSVISWLFPFNDTKRLLLLESRSEAPESLGKLIWGVQLCLDIFFA